MSLWNPATWFTPSPEEVLPKLNEQAGKYGLKFEIVTDDKGEKRLAPDEASAQKIEALSLHNKEVVHDPQINTLVEITTGNKGGVALDRVAELQKIDFGKIASEVPTEKQAVAEATKSYFSDIDQDLKAGHLFSATPDGFSLDPKLEADIMKAITTALAPIAENFLHNMQASIEHPPTAALGTGTHAHASPAAPVVASTKGTVGVGHG